MKTDTMDMVHDLCISLVTYKFSVHCLQTAVRKQMLFVYAYCFLNKFLCSCSFCSLPLMTGRKKIHQLIQADCLTNIDIDSQISIL